MLGATLGVWLVVARLLSGLFGSDKGIVVSAIAVALPLLIAIIAYISVELYALPLIEAEWAPAYLPWVGLGLLALGTAVVASKRLWGLGAGLTVVVLILSGGAACGAYYGAQLIIEVMDNGSSQIEKRDERINLEIDRAQ